MITMTILFAFCFCTNAGSCFGPVQSDKLFQFFFVARDNYGNLFDSSLRKRIAAKLWSAETPRSSGFSMDCDLCSTKVPGVYMSKCKIKKVGVHRISVQLNSDQFEVMGSVVISSGPPEASKSEICNVAMGMLSVSLEEGRNGRCKLILRDQFSNLCKGEATTLRMVSAEVSNIASTSSDGGYTCELNASQDQNFITIVLPSKIFHFLHVCVGGRDVVGSPALLQYKSNASFKQRVSKLRKSLACHGYTPTLTMDRSHLLETAINLLHPSLLQKTIRVRFGDEQGIDCGGVSK